MNLRHALFPVAGLGTRLLPASKVVAKEMLPILDKPLIQYAVEEAVEAGCEHLVFVINRHKHAIADHFDRAPELEAQLEKAGKHELLACVRGVLPSGIRTSFVIQPQALGLGHAVLCARHVIGDAPFAVLLPDDLLYHPGGPGVLKQMVGVAGQRAANVLAVEQVPEEQTHRYGIVCLDEAPAVPSRIRSLVEKPKPGQAPSDLAIVGRYILHPRIFDFLQELPPGAGGEIQLTDAIAALLREQEVVAHRFAGERFDCGNRMGVVAATMTVALGQADIAHEVRARMRRLLGTQP